MLTSDLNYGNPVQQTVPEQNQQAVSSGNGAEARIRQASTLSTPGLSYSDMAAVVLDGMYPFYHGIQSEPRSASFPSVDLS